MAVAVRETIIANPARKRKRRNVARKMSLKQKAAFGSKRVRAAAKAALSRQRKRKRNAPKKRTNRIHWLSKSAAGRPSQRRKKKNVAMGYRGSKGWRARKKKNPTRRRRARRTNPGEIFALVNPATKGRRSMARTRRRKNYRRRKNAAGSTRRSRRRVMHHRRRSNPGGAIVKDWLSLGAGAVVGSVGATQLPQLVLTTSNTGAVGYLANLAATGILAAAAHMFMKGNKALIGGIIAGGVGATIKRVIGDYSLLGSYGASLGMGDYLTNLNPQYTFLPTQSTGGAVAPVAVNVQGAGPGGMTGYMGRPLY